MTLLWLFVSLHCQVHNEGFLVQEDGNLHTRRVLLSEVTAEAACAFLQYLYAADTSIPSQVLSDVGALAVRLVCCCIVTYTVRYIWGPSPGIYNQVSAVVTPPGYTGLGEVLSAQMISGGQYFAVFLNTSSLPSSFLA